MEKEKHTMMNFKLADGTHFATNSIKPVSITEFDTDTFQLFMGAGDLNISRPMYEFFDTFTEARKWAECHVGCKIKMGKPL